VTYSSENVVYQRRYKLVDREDVFSRYSEDYHADILWNLPEGYYWIDDKPFVASED